MCQPPAIRVMIVDDHPMVRQSLAFALRSVADMLFVGEGSDGLEAIAFCQVLNPDVVLMDLAMPGMDGIEATRLIRSQYPRIKIIALTSFESNTTSRARVREAGASLCLDKQMSMLDLIGAIRQTMGDSSFSSEGFDTKNQ